MFSFLDLLTFVRRACSPSTVIRRIVDQRGEAIESAQSNIDASRQRLRQLINSITNSTTIDEYIFRVIKFDRWCGVFSICLVRRKDFESPRIKFEHLSCEHTRHTACTARTLLHIERAHHQPHSLRRIGSAHATHTAHDSRICSGDASLTSPVQPLGLIRARQLSLRDNCPIEGSH